MFFLCCPIQYSFMVFISVVSMSSTHECLLTFKFWDKIQAFEITWLTRPLKSCASQLRLQSHPPLLSLCWTHTDSSRFPTGGLLVVGTWESLPLWKCSHWPSQIANSCPAFGSELQSSPTVIQMSSFPLALIVHPSCFPVSVSQFTTSHEMLNSHHIKVIRSRGQL